VTLCGPEIAHQFLSPAWDDLSVIGPRHFLGGRSDFNVTVLIVYILPVFFDYKPPSEATIIVYHWLKIAALTEFDDRNNEAGKPSRKLAKAVISGRFSLKPIH
jgi:hypothetical protein